MPKFFAKIYEREFTLEYDKNPPKDRWWWFSSSNSLYLVETNKTLKQEREITEEMYKQAVKGDGITIDGVKYSLEGRYVEFVSRTAMNILVLAEELEKTTISVEGTILTDIENQIEREFLAHQTMYEKKIQEEVDKQYFLENTIRGQRIVLFATVVFFVMVIAAYCI